MHSKEVNENTIQGKNELTIKFNPYNLVEENRINVLLKGWKISKPIYIDDLIIKTFTKHD